MFNISGTNEQISKAFFFLWKLRSIHKFWIQNQFWAILGGWDICKTKRRSGIDKYIFIMTWSGHHSTRAALRCPDCRHGKRRGRADIVRGIFWKLRKYLDYGRLFTYIFRKNITYCGNIWLGIEYLDYLNTVNDYFHNNFVLMLEFRTLYLRKFWLATKHVRGRIWNFSMSVSMDLVYE